METYRPQILGTVGVIVLFIVAGSISGCSSLSVTTDHDPTADFSQYETYGYASQDPANPQSLLDAALNRSIDSEMERKGLRKSDSPDIAVVTQASVNEVVTGATVNHWNSGGWGWYDGWGGGFGTSTVSYNRYNQGTLVLDLVDTAQNKLVWRGIAEKAVDPNAPINQEELDEIVTKLMESFPPSSGEN